MLFFLVLFYISFVGLTIFISMKVAESRGKNLRILAVARQNFDRPLLRLNLAVQNFLGWFNNENLKKVFVICVRIAFNFLVIVASTLKFGTIVGAIKREFSVLSEKFKDMVRGKKSLKNRGAVSFFLKDVAEHKKREGYRI